MSYYLAPALEVLRAEINARWPGRDKTSDGWIGDAAHQATRSDHNPNDRGSVNALDVDEDGIDPWQVLAAIQRHPSAHYWIYEQTIADADDGWRRRPYYGTNPHDRHLHVSIRQTAAAEQDRRPWGLLEDDMTPDEMLNAPLYNPITQANAKYGAFIQSINSSAYWALQEAKKARLASEAAVAAVKGVDTAGIMARINEVAAAEQQRDAELVDRIVAALPAGNDPVSRDELEAALRSVLGSVDNAPATQ